MSLGDGFRDSKLLNIIEVLVGGVHVCVLGLL
jgi:hypothetical protein